jgi:23S rRNA pseudouridine2457 synthase
MEEPHRYFLLHKPYDMVSQFVSTHKVRLLSDIDFDFPEGTHAIGRLDKDSEGLLLLTTDKRITRLLFQGKQPHTRTYLVQVKRTVTQEIVQTLADGVAISAPFDSVVMTQPCKVRLLLEPPVVSEPIIPLHPKVLNSWLEISLTEGKFHQVRKMVGAVKHPCVRLIRTSIEDISLGDLQPGEVREVDGDYFFSNLHL